MQNQNIRMVCVCSHPPTRFATYFPCKCMYVCIAPKYADRCRWNRYKCSIRSAQISTNQSLVCRLTLSRFPCIYHMQSSFIKRQNPEHMQVDIVEIAMHLSHAKLIPLTSKSWTYAGWHCRDRHAFITCKAHSFNVKILNICRLTLSRSPCIYHMQSSFIKRQNPEYMQVDIVEIGSASIGRGQVAQVRAYAYLHMCHLPFA